MDGAARRARRKPGRGAPARSYPSCEPPFAERAAELGLTGATLGYDAVPSARAAYEERLGRDLERGTTGLGPHLDEIRLLAGDRDLRTFGSQGEQRLAVLSLLLAEAELLAERGRAAPLLLLDDALSELDAERRRLLSTRLGASGQTLVTATGAEALPLAPAQLLVVSARRGAGVVMERLDGSVRRALRGAGVPDAGVLAEVTRVWPEAVGPAIARAAWPQRVARDGTLYVNAVSSTWAFELARMEADDPGQARRGSGCSHASRAALHAWAGARAARARGRAPVATRAISGRGLRGRPGWPPRSRTRACARRFAGPSRQVSREAAATVRSDILRQARKTPVLQAFSRPGGA